MWEEQRSAHERDDQEGGEKEQDEGIHDDDPTKGVTQRQYNTIQAGGGWHVEWEDKDNTG